MPFSTCPGKDPYETAPRDYWTGIIRTRYAIAQANLGFMYENGRGVSQDYREALVWYRKAADQGNERAKNKITALASIDPDAKRDSNDVVAQVLNYSNFGNDDGVGGSYWYQDKSDKCRYKLFSQFGPRRLLITGRDGSGVCVSC